MRYLILSDLHSNWEALQAVAGEAQGGYDQALCCGDLVGYGGDPNAVVDWVRANCAVGIRGNHDRACAGLEELEWFNPVAGRRRVDPAGAHRRESRIPSRTAQRSAGLDGFELAHGSTSDEDEYVVTADEALGAFAYIESRLAFFGHTHVQGGYVWNRERVETIPSPFGRLRQRNMRIDPDCAYLSTPARWDSRAMAIRAPPSRFTIRIPAWSSTAGCLRRGRRRSARSAKRACRILADRLAVGR